MKQFRKMYLEILNVCNLQCSFCPPTSRPPQVMTVAEFRALATKMRPHGENLFLHVKGEPTMHPQFFEILDECHKLGFRVHITTNGTLLSRQIEQLCQAPAVYKVQISLHSFEASDLGITLDEYLEGILSLIANAPFIIMLRLWNQGGMDRLNDSILAKLHQRFDFLRADQVTENCYIQHGDCFEWADLTQQAKATDGFCLALRNQIAVLVDGTVVPCCLDNNGDLALGNLHEISLQQAIDSDRAFALYDGFSNRHRLEPLCQTCGFINRFD